MTTVNQRLSVHNVTFLGAPLADLEAYWAALGVTRLSILDSQLLDPEFATLLQRNTYTVEAVYHLFANGLLSTDPRAAQDALCAVIDAAASVGARTVYLLTGGRGALTWEQAAAQFCVMVNPCVEHANRVGVALAIENASALYADIHLAHTLRARGGVGIFEDLFACALQLCAECSPRRLQCRVVGAVAEGHRHAPSRLSIAPTNSHARRADSKRPSFSILGPISSRSKPCA